MKTRNPLFTRSIIAGTGLAAYLYLVSFDELIETEPVSSAPLFWAIILIAFFKFLFPLL